MIKQNKNAFSMVELMLLLLFVSLITAALMPVVTKKHFKIPKPASHGAYLCYDAGGGQLHEVRYSGKALTTVVFDRNVAQCKFEPPEKVSYFHVSAIGGGGGGGDSGYSGGMYTTMGPYIEQLSPIDITREMVDELHRDITDNDFRQYGGKLYGFVVGASSGAGGDQLYARRSDSYPCTRSHNETYTYTTTYRTSSCDGWETVTVDTPTSDDSSGSTSHWGSDSDSSRDSTTPSHSIGSTPNNPTTTDNSDHSLTTNSGGYGIAQPNGQITNVQPTPPNPIDAILNGGPVVPVTPDNNYGGETYNLKDKKLKLDLPKFRFYNPNDSFAMLHPKYAFLFSKVSNDLLAYTYTYERCTGYSYSTYSTTRVSHTTVCDQHRNYYSYGTSIYSGGAGAPGAVCRSNYKNGGVGLSHDVVTIDPSGRDGNDCYPGYNLSPEYDSPHYSSTTCFSCSGRPENGFTAPHPNSVIKFGSSSQGIDTVSAENSPRGGTGASCSGNGAAGIAGTSCSPAKVTEGCSPGRYGYCLRRWNSSTWEANTTYENKFTYSKNYMQYGLPGLQGQYRTMVIRSFKDKDITITIGSGGVKGTNGGKGGTGNPTIFGNVITASGGEGGEGGQSTPAEVLEGYRTGAESWPAGAKNASYVQGKRMVREVGGVEPDKPQPDNLSSNIMNFLAPQDSSVIANIMETYRIGYGGKGGGSRHNCWFGEYRKWLDGAELEHSYPLPPTSCRNNYERIEAENGRSGALIIRW